MAEFLSRYLVQGYLFYLLLTKDARVSVLFHSTKCYSSL